MRLRGVKARHVAKPYAVDVTTAKLLYGARFLGTVRLGHYVWPWQTPIGAYPMAEAMAFAS